MADDDIGGTHEALASLVDTARLTTLGKLVAGITHELNTPLAALTANHDTIAHALRRLHDILADEIVEPHELEEVRRIVRALAGAMDVNTQAMQRVRELVASLRTFGRPDRAQIDYVDLHEGIESALTLLRHRIGNGIRIVRDYDELPPVQCYPQRLNQVFMNLLLNAVQALESAGDGEGHGSGTVTIRSRREGEHVLIQLEDDGPGIAVLPVERIFEPGFTTKGSRVGMGLGLLIARQVIDLHGGTLTVRSSVGAGAEFSVRLPLRLSAPSPRSLGDDAVPGST
jgi:two-component system, NtrC family, sensor kinase